MTRKLDLADIQGNILCDYGSSFPKGRYLFLNIPNAAAGRDFIDSVRGKVTTSISWDATEGYPGELMTTKPKVAINIAFTFAGLLALKLPTATLGGMPFEFIDGMAKRAPILGDIVESDPQHWGSDLAESRQGSPPRGPCHDHPERADEQRRRRPRARVAGPD
jgi:hypothetical protein